MNKIIIKDNPENQDHQFAYVLSFQEANKMLPILRSDYFSSILISSASQLNPKDMKFLIQLTRLLKSDGQVLLQTANNQMIGKVLKSLKLFEGKIENNTHIFTKTQRTIKQQLKTQKLSIGFYSVEQQQKIDENELLQGENLQIGKKVIEKCETKPRACANCNCGRKDKQSTTTVSKQQLIESINVGKPVSGCGKCYLGDSFRCATCPYNGLPAFKPGDKLKLVQNGSVLVQQATTYVNTSGKIKLQI